MNYKYVKQCRLGIYLLAILITISCGQSFDKKVVKIDLINELQDCEEHNLHYTITKVYNKDYKSFEGQIILPELGSNLNNTNNNKLFFPEITTRKKRFTVEGRFSLKPKNGKEGLSSCLGVYKFKVLKTIGVAEIDI